MNNRSPMNSFTDNSRPINSRYVLKATGPSDWRDYEACEIGISIGNPCHEGDKFRSILQWADKRFERCVITLSDTQKRYTLMADGTEESAAYFKSRTAGDRWLEENRSAIQSMTNAQPILIRWDTLLQQSAYTQIYNDVLHFRDTDPGFQKALEKDARTYLSRRKSREESFNEQRAFENSLDFFVEEVACYILIGRTYQALRAYPAQDMACFAYMRGDNIPDHLKGLELAPHLELNFKKKIIINKDKEKKAA